MDSFSKESVVEHKLLSTLAVIRNKQHNAFFWQLIHRNFPFYVLWIKDQLFRGKNPFTTKKQLTLFIKYCQQCAPQPICMPLLNKSIDVSIIIPAYNQWPTTLACLNSILAHNEPTVNYEIILADDCSTDETIHAAKTFPGLIVVRTPQNMGFLRNCNYATQHARGRYILLLNNDTIVLPNWLSSLCSIMDNDHTAVIAGSKMLHPNGTIQEAGAQLFKDGSIVHVGDGWHRKTPIFNIARDVDYISGCCILIRKSFWDEIGGFDERYHEAYFEDCDIAMTAKAKNLRVIYQPQSEIIHFRHRSYANIEKNHTELKKKNNDIFLEKWFINIGG